MTFNKEKISAIILKNQYDACTPEELKMLELWYESLDDTAQLDKLENRTKNIKGNKIWDDINSKINNLESEEALVVEIKKRKPIYYIARIAAMIILLAGSYYTYNFWFSNKNISGNDDTIVYLRQINNSTGPKRIILPDNSLIWLDVNASIKYPNHFNNKRNISLLTGKAFFNVTHDSDKPFIVETDGGLKIKVLGTAFVIEQGGSNSSVKVSVLRGKVQVADDAKKYATLTRYQGVIINTTAKIANPLLVDSLDLTGWFSSIVALDNVTLKEVAASIKENFGYKIEFLSTNLSSKPCSITYNTTDNIDDILSLLDKIYSTTHHITDSTVYIKAF